LRPGSTQATLDELEKELPHELPETVHGRQRRGDDRE